MEKSNYLINWTVFVCWVDARKPNNINNPKLQPKNPVSVHIISPNHHERCVRRCAVCRYRSDAYGQGSDSFGERSDPFGERSDSYSDAFGERSDRVNKRIQ
ncbi:hypothetical protein VB711_25040 [Cronbergia sp. UHCC 0137]|uniref:hypothetical protein n=1 Tax=Cronbergia sp. UHCC 0137 TaxID=3110239 RepID=UPI002B1FF782|nr:hypothetical protein [Cronbergia sp. UHCC 0137]MEA5621074.1 hypothetical protein [Cronbergia sp. UHCC 0137]